MKKIVFIIISLISLQTIYLIEAISTNIAITGPYKRVQEILDKNPNKIIDLDSTEFKMYVRALETNQFDLPTASSLMRQIWGATSSYYQDLKKATANKPKQDELKTFFSTIKDLIQKHNNKVK